MEVKKENFGKKFKDMASHVQQSASDKLKKKELNKVLLCATGALLFYGFIIPHIVNKEKENFQNMKFLSTFS